MRALAKQPHARPLSAERFADELLSSIMATVTVRNPTQSFALPPARRRHPVRAAMLMGGIALAGIGTAVFLWQRPSDSHSQVNNDEPEPGKPSTEVAISPARAMLMDRSVVELEAELERVAVLRGHGSRAVAGAMGTYHERTRSVPPGRSSESYRRTVLADLILQWASHPPLSHSDSAIAELEAVFLRMNSPLDLQERRHMLHEAKNLDGASTDSIRARLLSWIDTHGLDYQTGDPGAELVVEDEPSTTD